MGTVTWKPSSLLRGRGAGFRALSPRSLSVSVLLEKLRCMSLGDIHKSVHNSFVLDSQKIKNNLISIDKKMGKLLFSSNCIAVKLNEFQRFTEKSVKLRSGEKANCHVV